MRVVQFLSSLVAAIGASLLSVPAIAQADIPGVVEPAMDEVLSLGLMMGGIGGVTSADGSGTTIETGGWCRDQDFPDHYMYRPNGTTDQHILMESDAGQALIVGNGPMVDLPFLRRDGGSISVMHANTSRTILYGLTDGLPAPQRLGPLLNGRQWLTINDRDGNVELNSDALPED